jgi:hypothetical protein
VEIYIFRITLEIENFRVCERILLGFGLSDESTHIKEMNIFAQKAWLNLSHLILLSPHRGG